MTVSSTGNNAGSLAIADSAGSTVTLDVANGGELTVGGSATANRTAGDLPISDNGALRVTGGTLKVKGSLNVNDGTVAITSGKVNADNFAQNAGSLVIGEKNDAAMVNLTGTVTVKSSGTLDTTSLLVSASVFTAAAGSVVKDSGAANFVSHATFTDDGAMTIKGAATFDTSTVLVGKAGSLEVASITEKAADIASGTFTVKGAVIDKGAASFTGGTIDDAGSITAASASFVQSALTISGKLVSKGALSLDDTAATVTKGGTVEVGSLNVGSSLVGFATTLTNSGTIMDKGDVGLGASTNGATIALTAKSVLSIGGAVADGIGITFLGNATLEFAAKEADTLVNKLHATINGFAKGNGIIDFSKIAFNAKDVVSYDAMTGNLGLEKANGAVLANVFLDTSKSYGGFKIMADVTDHTQIVVGGPRLA